MAAVRMIAWGARPFTVSTTAIRVAPVSTASSTTSTNGGFATSANHRRSASSSSASNSRGAGFRGIAVSTACSALRNPSTKGRGNRETSFAAPCFRLVEGRRHVSGKIGIAPAQGIIARATCKPPVGMAIRRSGFRSRVAASNKAAQAASTPAPSRSTIRAIINPRRIPGACERHALGSASRRR